MNAKGKSKTTIDSKTPINVNFPYISIKVKEIGNLPNIIYGHTQYSLVITTTIDGATLKPMNNNPFFPCRQKVTHKSDWEFQIQLVTLRELKDFVNLSSEFIIVKLIEEVKPPDNPADSAEFFLPSVTELGAMVIHVEDMIRNKGNVIKTQVFYGEEVTPLKKTWTNSPFMKYSLSLVDIEVPKEFDDFLSFEITFDSIINLPTENDFILELKLPYSEHKYKTIETQFNVSTEKMIYKNYTRLAEYPENLKYSKVLVESKKDLRGFDVPDDMILREIFKDNTIIQQNGLQRFLIPSSVLSLICQQESLTLNLTVSSKLTARKSVLNGKYNLKAFLESETCNYKAAIPVFSIISSKLKKTFIEDPVYDSEGFNACVVLDFKISSPIGRLPPVDPNIEINYKKLAKLKSDCEQNISKYLKLKTVDFVQNYQKNFKAKYLKQSDSLTNLKVFDNFYIYNEKDLLTAAMNYLSVNRSKYGNFRNLEVRKRCFIDLSDVTKDIVFKLDDRSSLPVPCTKELFELGYIEEANIIHIMKITNAKSKNARPLIDYAIFNLLILDPMKANECCNRALEIIKDMPIAKLIQSYMHFIFHEFEEAEEILIELTKQEPNFSEAWYALYIIFYQTNKLKELRFVEEGLFLASENPMSAFEDEQVLWKPKKTNDPKLNCIQNFIQWGCIGYAELALGLLLTKYGFDSFEYSYHMAVVNYYKGDYQLAIKRLLFFGSDWQQRIAIKLKVHCLLNIKNSKALEYLREIPRCHDRINNLIYLKVSKFYLELKKFKTSRYYAKKCCLKYQSYSAFKLLAMASYKCKDCAVTEMCCKILYEMNPHNVYTFCALGGLFTREDLAPQRIYCKERCNFLKDQQESIELQYIKQDLIALLTK